MNISSPPMKDIRSPQQKALHEKIRQGLKLELCEERIISQTHYGGEIKIPETEEDISIANECARWWVATSKLGFVIPVSLDREWIPLNELGPVPDYANLDEWLEAYKTKNLKVIHDKCQKFTDLCRKGFSKLTHEEQENVRMKLIRRKYREHLPVGIHNIIFPDLQVE
jgi:hypothetical protein